MSGAFKQAIRGVVPPAGWAAARRLWRLVRPARPGHRVLSALDEVDAELDRAEAAINAGSFDASFAVLDGFQMPYPADLPADPRSAEYRDREMAFHRRIAGRAYRAAECEQLDLPDTHRRRPFPYYTQSTGIIGEQLMCIGRVVRALDVLPGASVLEFGPGYGRLTLEMARSGLAVTAVDINPQYLDLIRGHAAREELRVELEHAGMLDYEPRKAFDRVVFYECFHHCEDHVAMVARLGELVAPGGAVIFAGEPIDDRFPIPWGVRRDGRSLWSIRRHGWLELGFRTDYFVDLLRRHGWAVEVPTGAAPWDRVFVARRAG
jgi:SAM-dependent methyltransferase